MTDSENITRLLRRVDEGHDGALDELMRTVYDDLEGIAGRHLRERFGRGLAGVTLEPAALVNESFMKLIRQRARFDNRGHFFAIATKVMLRVLIDYQRRRRAEKRGGDRERIALSLEGSEAHASAPIDEQIIDVDLLVDALERLEKLDARKADVVKLRVVWALAMPEIAQSLDISLATVERDWSFSKAWLARETAEAEGDDEGRPDADPRLPGEATDPEPGR